MRDGCSRAIVRGTYNFQWRGVRLISIKVDQVLTELEVGSAGLCLDDFIITVA